jgi:arylsulfatase
MLRDTGRFIVLQHKHHLEQRVTAQVAVFYHRYVLPRGKSWVNHLRSQDEHPAVHDDENHIHGWELFGNRAIRRGNWKAVLLPRQGGGAWELYNVADDPAEGRDLAEERPELLQELLEHWATYVAETGVEDISAY